MKKLLSRIWEGLFRFSTHTYTTCKYTHIFKSTVMNYKVIICYSCITFSAPHNLLRNRCIIKFFIVSAYMRDQWERQRKIPSVKKSVLIIESPDNIRLRTTLRKPPCTVCLPRCFHSAEKKKNVLVRELSFLRL